MKRIETIPYKFKNLRFHINLYIIIPMIFAGFSTLSLLVAYRLTHYYLERNQPPEWPLAFWGMVLILFTFACGLLVVRFIISPVKRFVEQTQTMGVLSDVQAQQAPPDANTNELYPFSRVFEQVTEILSKVEARNLFPEIVGQSTAIRAVLNQIIKVAPTDSTVLICGETGTGKELVANSIYRQSRRQDNPFVVVNCAAIPGGLLESELFGHEKGAFTGAVDQKPGKVELAHQGTLFLDEIGDMPLEIQAKVLRTLEEGSIVRLGGTRPSKVNVRFIAATNKDLAELVKKNAFRQDLFYRLNVFTVHLPPLRDRREDIPLLARHFLDQTASDKELSSSIMQRLMAYDWPGNIREIKNAVKSAVILAGEHSVDTSHLPATLTSNDYFPKPPPPGPVQDQSTIAPTEVNQTLDQWLQSYEKEMIINALTKSRGIQKKAANMLGIKERSLWHRLKKYEIDASAFKSGDKS